MLRLGLSFVLAVALWLYVTGQQSPSQAWDYPLPLTVTAQNVPAGLTVANDVPVVHVKVQADRNTTPVSSASFHTFVDMSGLSRGLHRVRVNVISDPGISVVSRTPSFIQVMLDSISERHVPVKPHIYSQPPEGYALGSIRVNPSTVTVSGPQSVVSQVNHAAIYISLAEAKSSISTYSKISLEDRQNATVVNRLLSTDPSQVQLTALVRPLSSFKTLPVLATIHGQPRTGFGVVGLSVRPAEITAFGSPAALNRASAVSTSSISVARRGAGTFTQHVRLRLPHGVSSNIRTVVVQTVVRPVAASTSVEIALTPLNVAQGLVVHYRPAKVLVTLLGPSPVLQSAAAHLQADINVLGLGAGTYYLEPQVSSTPDLHVEAVFPSRVTVTLSNATG